MKSLGLKMFWGVFLFSSFISISQGWLLLLYISLQTWLCISYLNERFGTYQSRMIKISCVTWNVDYSKP